MFSEENRSRQMDSGTNHLPLVQADRIRGHDLRIGQKTRLEMIRQWHPWKYSGH